VPGDTSVSPCTRRLRRTAPDLIVADVNGKTLALLDWLRRAGSAL
jgi:hypothetical protein